MKSKIWLGRDEHGGVASLTRPDRPKAESWSLEAIAQVHRPHDVTVSPDGRFVASIFDTDHSDVWVVSVDGGRPVRITTGRDLVAYWEDDAPTWSPDGERIAYSADGSVWVVPVAGGLPKKLTTGSSPLWLSDSSLVISVDRDEETRLALIENPDAWPTPLTEPGRNVGSAWVSAEHRILLYVDYPKDDLQRSDIWIHDFASAGPRRLTDEPGMHDQCPRLSPDGAVVAFISERSGWYEVYLVDSDGSSLTRLTSEESDLSGLDWSPDGNSLVAVRTRFGDSDLVTIDAGTGEVSVLAAGGEWSTPHWAGSQVVAVHETCATPPGMVRVGMDGSVETLLGQVPASIEVATHVRPEEVRYQSFDGTEVHGFLFRPLSADRGPVPAVVYPHGGPTSAYTNAWDGHAQYFVDKGYAWLAINFRGSTGYGRDFERANHGVWGVADTDDCLAAADYLSGLDWVDGSRLAIFGASYGSYMALACLARDPEHRYACGVAKYGDSDIATSWAQGDRGGREDLERMMGKPAGNREAYRQGSPLWMVENIARPLLVAHGERDERVHPGQSEQLVDELRRLDKTYEYVTYPTEGHGLLRSDPQVHFYQRLERFLDWYLM